MRIGTASIRGAIGVACVSAALGGCVQPPQQAPHVQAAPPPACAAGTPATGITFYFGQNGRGGRPAVTQPKWTDFARLVLTPNFPKGFTVFPARGQWLSPKNGTMAEEPTRVVRAVVPATQDVRDRITRVRAAYEEAYDQEAVGVEVQEVCADFNAVQTESADR